MTAAGPSTEQQLLQRLARLEARLRQHDDACAIRRCVTHYMALCDRLDAHTPLDELLGCFTEDAIWAGKGARYGQGFGSHQGRAAIGAMFRGYMGTPAHFALNVHFLTSEQITPRGDDLAEASWVMLQTSTFASGASHLNAAQLQLTMRRDTDGHWRIARFETENLFSRPVSHWQSDLALPVPASHTG